MELQEDCQYIVALFYEKLTQILCSKFSPKAITLTLQTNLNTIFYKHLKP
jgi:hypothetical protein